jgi:hypothetical protein
MASDAYTGALETRGAGGTLLIIKGQFGNVEGGHQMELGVLCFFPARVPVFRSRERDIRATRSERFFDAFGTAPPETAPGAAPRALICNFCKEKWRTIDMISVIE